MTLRVKYGLFYISWVTYRSKSHICKAVLFGIFLQIAMSPPLPYKQQHTDTWGTNDRVAYIYQYVIICHHAQFLYLQSHIVKQCQKVLEIVLATNTINHHST